MFTPDQLLITFLNARAEVARGPVRIELCGPQVAEALTARAERAITEAVYWDGVSTIAPRPSCDPADLPQPPYPMVIRVVGISVDHDSAYVEARTLTAWDGIKFRVARSGWLTERMTVKDFYNPRYQFLTTGWDFDRSK